MAKDPRFSRKGPDDVTSKATSSAGKSRAGSTCSPRSAIYASHTDRDALSPRSKILEKVHSNMWHIYRQRKAARAPMRHLSQLDCSSTVGQRWSDYGGVIGRQKIILLRSPLFTPMQADKMRKTTMFFGTLSSVCLHFENFVCSLQLI